jgi:hypothetical protein
MARPGDFSPPQKKFGTAFASKVVRNKIKPEITQEGGTFL